MGREAPAGKAVDMPPQSVAAKAIPVIHVLAVFIESSLSKGALPVPFRCATWDEDLGSIRRGVTRALEGHAQSSRARAW
jgi:hypothetical protein